MCSFRVPCSSAERVFAVNEIASVVKVVYTKPIGNKNVLIFGFGSDLSAAIAEAERNFTLHGGKRFGDKIPTSAYLFVAELQYSELIEAVRNDQYVHRLEIKQYFLN